MFANPYAAWPHDSVMTRRTQHAHGQQRLTAGCASTQVRRILAGDEELLAKLSKALLESYVDDNKEAKWCPSTPHCGNAIKVRLLRANMCTSSHTVSSLQTLRLACANRRVAKTALSSRTQCSPSLAALN